MPGRKKKNCKHNFRELAKQGATTYSLVHGPDGEEDDAPGLDVAAACAPKQDSESRKSDQQKFGVFFEDDYDYMQHLKDVSEFKASKMEQVVVMSQDEEEGEDAEEIFTVHQDAQTDFAHPQSDWDPEIAASLEKEFEFDSGDELEDNFMDLADPKRDGELNTEHQLSSHLEKLVHIGPKKDEEEDQHYSSDEVEFDDDDDEEWDTESEEEEDTSKDERPGKRVPRTQNELLERLDAQTRELFRREYTEDKIGALDCEELQGRCGIDSDLMQQIMFDKKNEDKNKKFTLEDLFEGRSRPVVSKKMQFVEELTEEELKERSEKVYSRAWSPKRTKWDCETILSLRSTTKNLPQGLVWPPPSGVVPEKKTKPRKEPEPRGLSLKEIQESRHADKIADAPPTFRPTGETPEEKRERKKAVKQHRKERREEKKANKMAFRADGLH